jgi:hypothetical protein
MQSDTTQPLVGDVTAQARRIVDEIYAMTRELVLSGEPELEEQEMDAYVKLVETREPLVAKLTELKNALDAEAVAALDDSEEFAAINQTIQDIGALDERHTRFMEHLSKDARKAYKQVKHGQRIHAGYTRSHMDAGSGRFDIKQ